MGQKSEVTTVRFFVKQSFEEVSFRYPYSNLWKYRMHYWLSTSSYSSSRSPRRTSRLSS